MKLECRMHWFVFVPRGFICLLLLVFGFLQIASHGGGIVFIGIIILDFLIMLPAFVRYMTNYLAVENNMLVGRVGFINSKKLSTPISKIQSIGLSNGLFGKVLGFHTITFSHAGTSGVDFTFPKMANAEGFVAEVNELINGLSQ